MFPVLFRTTRAEYHSGTSVSVHTVIHDFQTMEAALEAVDIINVKNADNGTTAIPLFRRPKE